MYHIYSTGSDMATLIKCRDFIHIRIYLICDLCVPNPIGRKIFTSFIIADSVFLVMCSMADVLSAFKSSQA